MPVLDFVHFSSFLGSPRLIICTHLSQRFCTTYSGSFCVLHCTSAVQVFQSSHACISRRRNRPLFPTAAGEETCPLPDEALLFHPVQSHTVIPTVGRTPGRFQRFLAQSQNNTSKPTNNEAHKQSYPGTVPVPRYVLHVISPSGGPLFRPCDSSHMFPHHTARTSWPLRSRPITLTQPRLQGSNPLEQSDWMAATKSACLSSCRFAAVLGVCCAITCTQSAHIRLRGLRCAARSLPDWFRGERPMRRAGAAWSGVMHEWYVLRQETVVRLYFHVVNT